MATDPPEQIARTEPFEHKDKTYEIRIYYLLRGYDGYTAVIFEGAQHIANCCVLSREDAMKIQGDYLARLVEACREWIRKNR